MIQSLFANATNKQRIRMKNYNQNRLVSTRKNQWRKFVSKHGKDAIVCRHGIEDNTQWCDIFFAIPGRSRCCLATIKTASMEYYDRCDSVSHNEIGDFPQKQVERGDLDDIFEPIKEKIGNSRKTVKFYKMRDDPLAEAKAEWRKTIAENIWMIADRKDIKVFEKVAISWTDRFMVTDIIIDVPRIRTEDFQKYKDFAIGIIKPKDEPVSFSAAELRKNLGLDDNQLTFFASNPVSL